MSVDVVPVRGRRALSEFVSLPWALIQRSAHPEWVPPLRAMVRDALDERGNPFYRNAARELFVAYRRGRPVGRIAAIESRRHNEVHGDRVGFFGFFEALDDADAVQALIAEASAWLRGRGLDRIRGPVSPTMHDECGLLIEGFDRQVTFMTAWNPAFYAGLLEAAGLQKAKDLLGFWISFDKGVPFPESFTRVLERVRKQSGFTFRQLDRSRFDREVELAWGVYNEAWEANWGFVPMTRAEFDHMAGMLKLLVVDQFACFAEVDGQAAGFAMALPDYNRTLQRIPGGRLLPFGLPMLLRDRARLRTGRALLLGVKEHYRRRNIYFVLLHELLSRAHAYGATGADASWILEDNDAMLAFFREAGIPPSRRWRIYEKTIDAG